MKTTKRKSITYILRHKKAFTIAELLIALMVTGLLIAAVAVAFNASARNYNVNRDIFNAVNKARQALTLMTSQLRTAQAVDPNTPAGECAFFSAGGESVLYRFNAAEKKLYMVKAGGTYLLCDNVSEMTFNKTTDPNGTLVESVQLSMTVSSGSIEKNFSTAVALRKNLQ